MSVLFGCMRFKKRFQSFRSISNLRWLDHEWMIKKEQTDPLANKVVNKFYFIPILHHSILELEIKLPHSVLFLTDQFINSTKVKKKYGNILPQWKASRKTSTYMGRKRLSIESGWQGSYESEKKNLKCQLKSK